MEEPLKGAVGDCFDCYPKKMWFIEDGTKADESEFETAAPRELGFY